MNMTPEQRQATPPWLTQDVPNEQQITRPAASGRQFSLTPVDRDPFTEPGTAQPTGPSITAYHGSPHSFDQFDLSKIGTGEGAQAYGHGLYFAGNEDVAQYYKQALSEKPSIDGKPILDQNYNIANSTEHGYLDKIVRESFGDMPLTKATLEANIQAVPVSTDLPAMQKIGAARVANSMSALAHLNDLQANGRIGNVSPGSMYQVAIHADPEHFLDWDKPLSEQHPAVKEAIAPHYGDVSVVSMPGGDLADLRLGKSTIGTFKASDIGDPVQKAMSFDPRTGEQIYRALGERPLSVPVPFVHPMTGEPGVTNQVLSGPASAAQKLRQAGIPGIRYLDQGSRGAGTGSHNYVVFSPENLQILKKYGLAGLGIGAGGAAMLGQNQPARAGVRLTPVQGNPFEGTP
jgi:hypothetical protein